MKKIYLYGNWKMNMTQAETAAFYQDFAREVASSKEIFSAMEKGMENQGLEVAVFPPFTSLNAARDASGAEKKFSPLLGAQNVYFEPKGAFTGEVSIPMLQEIGCDRVIIGHSERRAVFKEPDEMIARKVKACLDAGLIPVLCYGETLEEREAQRTFDVVSRQLSSALKGLTATEIRRIVYAYEPVWAIGTGKSATSAEAQEVCGYSKKLIQELADASLPLVVLYGGSVNPGNARELLSMDDVDGALVGGASLKADSFLQIYKAFAGI